MRHSVYGKKLGRSKNQRTALTKSLVRSLILSEKIQTTQAKAKAVKGLIDRIINKAKNPDTRRLVSQFLTQKEVTEKLFNQIVPRLGNRNSGYTSVVKMGTRLGDGAMMVQIRLLLEESKDKKGVAKKENGKQELVKKKSTKAETVGENK